MFRFRSFLYLAERAPIGDGPGSSQNTSGVLHELIVGQYLNGRRHMESVRSESGEAASPQEIHDALKSTLSPNEYDEIHRRAKRAAEDIMGHLSRHGDIHSVHWTSKPGDLEKVTGIPATQAQDASDIVVTTKKEEELKHHGISLKVSENSPSTHVPLSNPGLESTYGGEKHVEDYKNYVFSKAPELKNLPNDPNEKKNDAASKRKRWALMNPERAEHFREMGTRALHAIANHVKDFLKDQGTEVMAKHLKEKVLYAMKTPMQEHGHSHFRHTTYNDGTTDFYDPSTKFNHILDDHHKIDVKTAGTGVVFMHDGRPFARHSFKFNSRSDVLSSVKGVGNTTGSKKVFGQPKPYDPDDISKYPRKYS